MTENFEYLLKQCGENQKALLIITPGIDPMISDMLIQNVQRAGYSIQPPSGFISLIKY